MENSKIYIVGAAGILLAVIAGLALAIFSDPLGQEVSADTATTEQTVSMEGGVSISGKNYSSPEAEIAALQRENERLKERIEALTATAEAEKPEQKESGVKVPKNAKEAGTVLGNLRRARFEMKERWPDGPPDRDSPEYAEYIAARQQMAEGMASMIMVGTVMRDATPEQQLEFGASQLTAALELDEKDSVVATKILAEHQDALVLDREMIPEDEEERRAFFDARRKAREDMKTAVKEALPAYQAEMMDKIFDRGFLSSRMWGGRGGPPSGRGRGGADR